MVLGSTGQVVTVICVPLLAHLLIPTVITITWRVVPAGAAGGEGTTVAECNVTSSNWKGEFEASLSRATAHCATAMREGSVRISGVVLASLAMVESEVDVPEDVGIDETSGELD